ncbi:unnamed protein product [Polarella glacialis]|uniref:Protein xylosyltransferase n=1 Tax=Polarella glacialis TaxID=89957 RepID=A0A813DQZ8_POLGL|nr:unnamed protein product [Polarella glacialis]CAE8628835.1 unnamed protein product [Polarella glacialis]
MSSSLCHGILLALIHLLCQFLHASADSLLETMANTMDPVQVMSEWQCHGQSSVHWEWFRQLLSSFAGRQNLPFLSRHSARPGSWDPQSWLRLAAGNRTVVTEAQDAVLNWPFRIQDVLNEKPLRGHDGEPLCQMGVVSALTILLARHNRDGIWVGHALDARKAIMISNEQAIEALVSMLVRRRNGAVLLYTWPHLAGDHWPVTSADIILALYPSDSLPLGRSSAARLWWQERSDSPRRHRSLTRAGRHALSKRPHPTVRIAVIVAHIYMMDILIGARDACEDVLAENGVEHGRCEVLAFGFNMAASQIINGGPVYDLCETLGSVCRYTGQFMHAAHVIDRGIAYEDKDRGIAVHWKTFKNWVAGMVEEDPFLRKADQVFCGYPFVTCFAAAAAPSWRHVPVAMNVFGLLTEYVDRKTQREIMREFGRDWVGSGQASVSGRRLAKLRQAFVVTLVDFDTYNFAFAEKVSGLLPRVPFCGRYLSFLRQQPSSGDGGVEPSEPKNGQTRTALLWNLTPILPAADIQLLKLLLASEGEKYGLHRRGWRIEDSLSRWNHRFQDRFKYSAVILIPWDWTLTTFLEWYSMSVPIFVPSPSLMRMHIQFTTNTGHRRYIRYGSEYWLGVPASRRPWNRCNGTTPERISYWYERTDFWRLPAVQTFDSAADIVSKLAGLDEVAFGKLVRQMQAVNRRALRSSSAHLRQMLRQVM